MKIQEIELKLIQDNPYQTREQIEYEPLKILTKSIRERGLINPITLLKNKEGYFIVNGHRRFSAYKKLVRVNKKYLKIPAIVKKRNLNNELMIDLVHENLIREDLNPYEKAQSIKLLIGQIKTTRGDIDRMMSLVGKLKNYNRRGHWANNRDDLTKGFKENDIFELQEILKSIGISENNAVSYLTILKLPQHMKQKLIFSKRGINREGKLLIKHAEQLARINDPKYQQNLFIKCIEGKMVCRTLQATVDTHLKKVERGEWNGIKQSNLSHKFKDDLERLEELKKEMNKLSQKTASFKVDTLIKLDTTLEKEEFESSMIGLRKEMDLVANLINEKLIDKGMKPIKQYVDEFEVRIKFQKHRAHFRTNIPMSICKKLNLSENKPEFLKFKIVGRRDVTEEK